MNTVLDDSEPLIVSEVTTEELNNFINHLSNSGISGDRINLENLTNISSIALINDNQQVVVLRATAPKKPLVLFLAAESVEQTVCYTTYDASRRKGRRSCAHRDTTKDGTTTSVSVCLENNAFYDDLTKENYYLECNPAESHPKRALLYKAELYTDDSGMRRWRKVPNSPVILDEK